MLTSVFHLAEEEHMLLTLANGSTIAYRQNPGTTPGVIFLGGFMSDMTGTKATALETCCRQQSRAFVCFDYQGHGASSGRFEDGTLGRWTEDALMVLDQLTTGPQILVGSSMGAWIMFLMAQARPERIAGLVGVACAADFSEYMLWQNLDSSAREQLRKEGIIYLPSDYDEESPYPITLRFIEEARNHLLLKHDTPLPISCPVRLLHGMQDPHVPWQVSTQIAARLTSNDVQVLLIKDGEHRLSRDGDLRLLIHLLGEVTPLQIA